MRKSFWLSFFLVCAGIVLGSMLADLTAGFPALSWLSYGLNFGTQSPLVLDLNAITLTFGITLNITISTLLCVALALVLGRCFLEK